VLPLVAFTGSKRLMGPLAAPRWLIAVAWGIAAVIVCLNGWMLWGLITG
jgi:manganese transport protein